MNMGMPTSIIRMPFLFLSFFLFLKKSLNWTRRPAKVSLKGTSFCHFKSQITTTNKPIKDKLNKYCPIIFISYSDVSIFWLADVSSIVLFPIYLRYHPDGLGGSVKPVHYKLLLPTPKDSNIQSHANSQAPTNIVMHIQWGAFKSFLYYIVMHIRCISCIWLIQVALGAHSRKLNKFMEIKASFPLFQQNIISIDGG